MAGSFPAAVRGRRRRGAGFILRAGRRTLAESLYLLTAPVIAVAGLLLVLGGVCVATAGVRCLAGRRSWPALLSDASALHRRISGLEQERDAARAQTVAAVTAEAAALRRPERDIHDGPQQRLVRLAMDLGRAQHHLGSRPEAVREALADAVTQTQEALDELRALSHGSAPPILWTAACARRSSPWRRARPYPLSSTPAR
jgi:signal transduction histidine kinase